MLSKFAMVGAVLIASAWAQTASTPAKPSTAAKPAAAASAQPVAIIETTAGKMTCTLFPDKAPIGVDNFIGLATGKKDWRNPVGKTMHGVPLYDGTIFHRVIPELHDSRWGSGGHWLGCRSGDLVWNRGVSQPAI